MRYQVRPLVAWTDPETRPREQHRFSAPWSATLDLLTREASHLGAKLVVVQLDVAEVQIRRDGMLRADAKVGHPGAVVSFESRFGPLRYAADTYRGPAPAWQANVRAIALSLEALRSVDRWGVSRRGEQYRGWTAIEAPAALFPSAGAAEEWMRAYAGKLHITGPGDRSPLRTLYRLMAAQMHPDKGAPRAEWDRLDEARRVLAGAGML